MQFLLKKLCLKNSLQILFLNIFLSINLASGMQGGHVRESHTLVTRSFTLLFIILNILIS